MEDTKVALISGASRIVELILVPPTKVVLRADIRKVAQEMPIMRREARS